MTSSFSISGHSTAGRKTNNDDALAATYPCGTTHHTPTEFSCTKSAQALQHFGHCFIICDGVSAAAQGGDGARYTAEQFIQHYYQAAPQWQVEQRGKAALQTINQRLYQQGCKTYGDPQKGFACTFSALIIHGNKAHIFHIGDTRIYRNTVQPNDHSNGDTLWQQLTTDHSAATKSRHSYLENAIGADARIHIEYLCLTVNETDIFLLSCDGIHDFVSGSALQDYTCKLNALGLVDHAFKQGSDDNLSCMAIRVDKLASAPNYSLIDRHLTAGEDIDQYRLLKQVKHEHLYLNQNLDKNNLYHVFHYRAVHLSTNTACTIAIPFIHNKGTIFSQRAISAFYRTYFQLSQLNGPETYPTTHSEMQPAHHYVVYAALPEETLASLSAKYNKLSIDLLLTWMEEILGYAAQLKPKGLCIANFSASDFYVNKQGKLTLPFVRLNHIQTELGHFCAPEQKLYNSPVAKDGIAIINHCHAEIFSCAAMLHEYLAGLHPYRLGMNKLENEVELSSLQYHSLITERSDIPLWFDAALRKALSLNEADRYPSIKQFLHDLRHPNPAFLDTTFIEQYSRKLPIVPVWKVFAILWFSSIAVMAYLIIGQ